MLQLFSKHMYMYRYCYGFSIKFLQHIYMCICTVL